MLIFPFSRQKRIILELPRRSQAKSKLNLVQQSHVLEGNAKTFLKNKIKNHCLCFIFLNTISVEVALICGLNKVRAGLDTFSSDKHYCVCHLLSQLIDES